MTPNLDSKLPHVGTTIFTVMSALALDRRPQGRIKKSGLRVAHRDEFFRQVRGAITLNRPHLSGQTHLDGDFVF